MKHNYVSVVLCSLFLFSALSFGQHAKKTSIPGRNENLISMQKSGIGFHFPLNKFGSINISLSKTANTKTVNPNEVIYQLWDTTGAVWVNYFRILISANADTILAQTWTNSNWVDDSRGIATYDGNNNLIQALEESWNGSAWVNSFLTTYSYDSNNNDTLEVDQQWSGTQWDNVYKYTYTYDSNHNVLVEVDQLWLTSQWFDSDRYTSTYSGNNLITYLAESSNFVSWSNASLDTYTYDGNNNRITDVYQLWNGIGWQNSSKDTMGYNSGNYLTSDLYLLWNGANWDNTSLQTNTYDINNNRVRTLYQDWNSTSWDNTDQDSAGYNSNGDISFDIFQGWSGTDWVNETKYIYNYAGVTAVDNNLTTVPSHYYLSNNYPNPFNPTTNIKYSLSSGGFVTLKVYDIIGREVATLVNENQSSGNYTVRFDGSGLSSGVYLYQLKVNNFVSTKKLVLMK
jgi:hypothetical protein